MKKMSEANAAAYKDERLKTAEGGLYESLFMDRIYRRTKMTGLVLDTEPDKAKTLEKIWQKEESSRHTWKMCNANNAVSVASVGGVFEISVR